MAEIESLLDHPAISGCYLFPQPRRVAAPQLVQVDGAELACYRRIVDPARLTLVHFHGNGEAVAAEASRHFNHQRKLAEYRNPLLVLHAKHDDLVDVSHAERNFRWSASSQKRLVTFDRGDHNSIMSSNRTEYFAALRLFFDGRKAERGGTET